MNLEYLEIFARFYLRRHQDTQGLFCMIENKLATLGTVVSAKTSELRVKVPVSQLEGLERDGIKIYNYMADPHKIISSKTFRLVSSEPQVLDKVFELVGDYIVAARLVRERSTEKEAL